MSDMKCPFCQQELNQDSPQIIECKNDDCKKSYFMYGSQELWQELIRTKKQLVTKCNQLEIAVDELKRIDWCATDYGVAQDALDEITAILENKNGNC